MVDALTFPVEEIPDADAVFMRVHESHFREGVLQVGAFRNPDGGMSVNWDKYASAELTRQQARRNPEKNGVVTMPVGSVRRIRSLDVKHIPEPDNRAHSEINLPSDHQELTEVRIMLRRIADVVLTPVPSAL